MKQVTYSKNSKIRSTLAPILLSALALLLLSCGEKSSEDDNATIDVENHKVRAETYIKNGQFRPAIIEARNIIKKQPASTEGYVLLAEIYNEIGQGKSAITVLENERIADKNSDYWMTLGEAYYATGKYQSSSNLLDEHPEISNQYPQEYLLLKAQNALGLNDITSAQAVLEQLLCL